MSFPTTLQPLWDALYGEVSWLHSRWIIYRQLFGTNPKRIDLLNESAALFFYTVEEVLLGNVQLTLSKLADPLANRAQDNLVLATLFIEVEAAAGDVTFTARLAGLLTKYRAACKQIINRRHKHLAHYDRNTLLNAHSSPLPGPSRQEIENALAALRDFMNAIENHFTHATTAYDLFIQRNDGNDLLFVLRTGLRYQQLVDGGSIKPDDIKLSPYYRV